MAFFVASGTTYSSPFESKIGAGRLRFTDCCGAPPLVEPATPPPRLVARLVVKNPVRDPYRENHPHREMRSNHHFAGYSCCHHLTCGPPTPPSVREQSSKVCGPARAHDHSQKRDCIARLCHFLPNSDVINTPFGRSHEYSIGSPEAVLNTSMFSTAWRAVLNAPVRLVQYGEPY